MSVRHISTVQISSSHSLYIEYCERMVGKPCNFPPGLSLVSQASWMKRTYEVWQPCDGFICHSQAGEVMNRVTGILKSAKSKETPLHFVDGCAFEM